MADGSALMAEIEALAAAPGQERALLDEVRPIWPRRARVEFHYARPVVQQALR